MNGAPQSPNGLQAELEEVRRRIAELERSLADLEQQRLASRAPNAVPERDLFVEAETPGERHDGGDFVFGRSAGHYPLYRAQQSNLVGMTFSGGGIRSATFNLGILHGLADLDLLRRIDYLSAVSGGSYIASWLAAWVRRSQDGVRRVQRWLSPIRSPHPDDASVRPIRFLRQYSNYLTPRVGLFTNDTWAAVSVWLRNILLNQTTLILVLAATLLIPHVLLSLARQCTVNPVIFFFFASVLLVLGSAAVGMHLQSFQTGRKPWIQSDWLYSASGVQLIVVGLGAILPAFLWTFCAVRALSTLEPVLPHEGLSGSAVGAASRMAQWIGPGFAGWLRTHVGSAGFASVVFFSLLISACVGRVHRCFLPEDGRHSRARLWKAVLAVLVCSAVAAVITGLVTDLILQQIAAMSVALPSADASFIAGHLVMFGPLTPIALLSLVLSLQINPYIVAGRVIVFGPLVFVALLSLAVTVQIGLLGRQFPDERREWWSRLGGLLLIYSGAWTALSAIALYGPLWVGLLIRHYAPLAATGGLAWAVHTIGGVLVGRSPSTFADGESSPIWKKYLAVVAPPVFIVGALLLLSYGIQAFLTLKYSPDPATDVLLSWEYWRILTTPPWLDLAKVTALLALIAYLWATRIDVNEFSMHHFYRNRLVRCYLGASRPQRDPNLFTGFDIHDDLKLSELKLSPPPVANSAPNLPEYVGPYLLVDTALNLVAGDELAWQERRAESFIFSPLYCGYEHAPSAHLARRLTSEGYRPTYRYACPDDDGPSLGTAVGISGAAANPNMGYHSSPSLGFLMTLFNVRLGWWMGNTRDDRYWEQSSPANGLLYLLNELSGNTKDDSAYINLSDGGHFENLGLYELVRRRCRYIIVCDSEEDAGFTFGGLGNAVRKCRMDFGVDIDLDVQDLRPVSIGGVERAHCAVGEIRYPGGFRGRLLYIKASLTADEPVDVREYSWRERIFPHQSTADQFFDESQFESYRTLGRHVATAVLGPADNDRASTLFDHLQALWSPEPPGDQDDAARHSEAYTTLLTRVSENDALENLDPTLLGGAAPGQRADHYVYTAMIEFMHEVMRDTGLDTRTDHPRLVGWMATFTRWAQNDEFQRSWEVVRGKYDVRFRRFVERLQARR